MRAERITPPGNTLLWVFGFSWKRRCISAGMVHRLKTRPLPEFWVDWSKTRAMANLDGAKSVSAETAISLEACARRYIEDYAGRTAALTASYGQDDLGEGEIHCWAYVNHSDIPGDLRARCGAELYGDHFPPP